MKTTIIFCFLLIVVASAYRGDDDKHKEEIQNLMKEAKQVLEETNTFMEQVDSHLGEYLLGNMRYEVSFVKELLEKLDKQKDDKITVDKLHKITEEFEYRKRRINEEEQIIKEVGKNDPSGWTKVEVLIKRCNDLEARAQDFLNEHPNDQHREVNALKNEIGQVNNLNEKLGQRASEKKPYTYREELELDKHEKSISKLIEDIKQVGH